MQIVALLPIEHLTQLMVTLGDIHVVHAASEPVALHQLLCTVDADLMMLDPMTGKGEFGDAVEEIVGVFRDVPLVVYTTVSAASMACVLRLAPLGLRHLVLYGIDDDPRALMELIERIPSSPLAEAMLTALRDPLALLPMTARRAVAVLFHSPSRVRTGADLAALAGMTRRSLYRHMAIVGLQPRLLIDAALLVRAYSLLRPRGSRLKDASARLGFARPETLSQLFREWTGYTARSVHQALDPASFVQLLARNVIRAATAVEDGTHCETELEPV